MNKTTDTAHMDNEQQARRKLLKMATYVPPAILGVMMSGNKIAEAGNGNEGSSKTNCKGGTIVISANGNACCPCVENPNSKKCAKAKCKLGNTAFCKPKNKKK